MTPGKCFVFSFLCTCATEFGIESFCLIWDRGEDGQSTERATLRVRAGGAGSVKACLGYDLTCIYC